MQLLSSSLGSRFSAEARDEQLPALGWDGLFSRERGCMTRGVEESHSGKRREETGETHVHGSGVA